MIPYDYDTAVLLTGNSGKKSILIPLRGLRGLKFVTFRTIWFTLEKERELGPNDGFLYCLA